MPEASYQEPMVTSRWEFFPLLHLMDDGLHHYTALHGMQIPEITLPHVSIS